MERVAFLKSKPLDGFKQIVPMMEWICLFGAIVTWCLCSKNPQDLRENHPVSRKSKARVEDADVALAANSSVVAQALRGM